MDDTTPVCALALPPLEVEQAFQLLDAVAVVFVTVWAVVMVKRLVLQL